jgi:hypothetical protein
MQKDHINIGYLVERPEEKVLHLNFTCVMQIYIGLA